MKKILAVAFATMFMLASVPAFACGGDKSAKKSEGEESLMTSVDDGDKTDAKTTKKKKDAKKADAKKSEETEGEV